MLLVDSKIDAGTQAEDDSNISRRRRRELADFLRSRRSEIVPESVGLPHTGRRRTPGLRREEVAELAGISTALYSWLEQGRDVPVSRRIVDAIALALQLPQSERTHLHNLASKEGAELDETITPTLKAMVCSLVTHPIFVLNHSWDIVFQNRAAEVLFGRAEDAGTQNLLEAMFTDDALLSLFPNWEEVAAGVVELFRYDFAQYAEELRPFTLVEKLRADPRFEAIWERHRVSRSPHAVRHMNHPLAGRLAFQPSTYAVVESPGLRLMIFTPGDDQTMERIKNLVEPQQATAP